VPETGTITVPIKAKLDVSAARVPVGVSTILGIAAAIGTVIAALKSNDVATAVAGAATITTMLGRYGQAIVIARNVARAALPYVGEIAKLPDPSGPS
jgi:hypothetical protein